MNDASAVQSRQTVADLAEYSLCGFDVEQLTAIHPERKSYAVDVLAQGDANTVLQAQIIDFHKIAVLDPAQGLQNREVSGRRDPPDLQLSCNVVAHQVDIPVYPRDKRKIP